MHAPLPSHYFTTQGARTKAVEDTTDPVWDERLCADFTGVPVEEWGACYVHLVLLDQDDAFLTTSHDYVAHCTVPPGPPATYY